MKQRTNALTKRLGATAFWNDLPFILCLHPNQTELRQIINDRLRSRKHVAFIVTGELEEEDNAYINDFMKEYEA